MSKFLKVGDRVFHASRPGWVSDIERLAIKSVTEGGGGHLYSRFFDVPEGPWYTLSGLRSRWDKRQRRRIRMARKRRRGWA